MHPSKSIFCSKSEKLRGKRVILCVTGSIAACETVKLAREMLRHGAEVIPVMSKESQKIICPQALEFATGKKPILELGGMTEHVTYTTYTESNSRSQLLLVAPATANIIAKIAHGIADTPISTFVLTAAGAGIPILVTPSMHHSMWENKVTKKNITLCREQGVVFISPKLEENKAKFPQIETILANVFRALRKKDFHGKKVLVIGGSTVEPLDTIRYIVNRSSGRMAIELAKESWERGADTELWLGKSSMDPPDWIQTRRFETSTDLIELIPKSKEFGIILDCAAVVDYKPDKIEGKIPSTHKDLSIRLKAVPKIIDEIRKIAEDSILVGFKAEDKNLIEKSVEKLKEAGLDFIVANPLSAFGSGETEIKIIDKEGKICEAKGKKSDLAEAIFNVILEKEKLS
jgi:phosphopantothenoylcysteine decarboxylase/phosphopantothenate--cysteine ligase